MDYDLETVEEVTMMDEDDEAGATQFYDDHDNCTFDISVCGNLTEEYKMVRTIIWRHSPDRIQNYKFPFSVN